MVLSIQHVGGGVAAGVIPLNPHRVRVLLKPTVETVVVFMQSSTKPEGCILPSGNCKHWPSACHHWCAVRHLFQPQLWADRQYHVTAAWRYIRTPKYEMPPITTFGSNSKECFAVLVVKDLSSLVVKKICKRWLPWGEACGTRVTEPLGRVHGMIWSCQRHCGSIFNIKYRQWVSSNSFFELPHHDRKWLTSSTSRSVGWQPSPDLELSDLTQIKKFMTLSNVLLKCTY